MSINNQPIPILLQIFKHLSYLDHLRLRSVCKKYLKIINSEEISGVEPRNIFECMLDDNIYYWYKYLSVVNKNVSTWITYSVFDDIYNDYKICEMLSFFCNKYMQNSLSTFFLDVCVLKNLSLRTCVYGDDYCELYDNIFYFVLEQNVINDDLHNIKKLLSISNQICPEIFECVAKFGYLEIFKFLSKTFTELFTKNLDNLLIILFKNDHEHIAKYIFNEYSNEINIQYTMAHSMFNNSTKILKYVIRNNLADSDLNLYNYPYYSGFSLKIKTMKFYIKYFNHTPSFIKNIEIIFRTKIDQNDYDVVNYLLVHYPKFTKQIYPEYATSNYSMVNLLMSHNIYCENANIISKILHEIKQNKILMLVGLATIYMYIYQK